MPIPGKLEVTIKINQLPTETSTDKNGWTKFRIDCGNGRVVEAKVRPRMWNKLTEAAASGKPWVSAITGRMGGALGQGFLLDEPAVQVFIKEPAPQGEPTPGSASGASEGHPEGQ